MKYMTVAIIVPHVSSFLQEYTAIYVVGILLCT